MTSELPAESMATCLWNEVFCHEADDWALASEDQIAEWVAKDLRECDLLQRHPNGVSRPLAPGLSEFLVDFMVRSGLPEAVAGYLHKWVSEEVA